VGNAIGTAEESPSLLLSLLLVPLLVLLFSLILSLAELFSYSLLVFISSVVAMLSLKVQRVLDQYLTDA
jgi:hypothetical protein